MLGLIPALWRIATSVRERSGVLTVAVDAAVGLGFAALAYLGLVGGLLGPDVSF